MTRERPLWRVVGVLVLLASIPAVALAITWRWADGEAASAPTTTTTTTLPPGPPSPVATTPLLSWRRIPGPTADRLALEADQATLDAAVSGVGSTECAAAHVTAELGVSANGATPLIPASNMKLLTAAVAHDVLGDEHRYVTSAKVVEVIDGVVPGDLYVVGTGDPVLATADVVDSKRFPAINTTSFDALADGIVAAGVVAIEGAVVGDGTRYDDEFGVPTWGDGIFRVEAGPYDALLVNDGVILNGGLGVNPNQSAAEELVRLLRARGVSVGLGSSHGLTPPEATTVLAQVGSEPLPAILEELLATSDDNTAELLLKEIGVAAGGGGARLAGLDVVGSRLDGWGADTTALVLDDGSGLSRENRLTCDALVDVLVEVGGDSVLADALPVAGRSGTLTDELVGTAAEGVVRAKTGTLTGVKALSGFTPDANGGDAAFAVVLNGDQAETRLAEIVDRLVSAISAVPTEPNPAPLSPR